MSRDLARQLRYSCHRMVKRLYFLRHGEAADRVRWLGNDSERPLIAKGRKAANDAARIMTGLKIGVDLIVTSPLVRANQTAEILARGLAMSDRLTIDPRLAPGFGPTQMTEILHIYAAKSAVLLVGHEPDLSCTIAQLIGGGRIKLKKASLSRVDIIGERPMRCELVWLITPKLMACSSAGASD